MGHFKLRTPDTSEELRSSRLFQNVSVLPDEAALACLSIPWVTQVLKMFFVSPRMSITSLLRVQREHLLYNFREAVRSNVSKSRSHGP